MNRMIMFSLQSPGSMSSHYIWCRKRLPAPEGLRSHLLRKGPWSAFTRPVTRGRRFAGVRSSKQLIFFGHMTPIKLEREHADVHKQRHVFSEERTECLKPANITKENNLIVTKRQTSLGTRCVCSYCGRKKNGVESQERVYCGPNSGTYSE